MRVTALNVYPVKSCAGTQLQEAVLDRRGIVHDREFMVVDARRRFVTQREQPRLALIHPVLADGTLTLTAPAMPPIKPVRADGTLTPTAPAMPSLTIEPREPSEQGRARYEVSIWDDTVVAADQGDSVADWLSTYLGIACRLVRMPADVVRPVDPEYVVNYQDQVGFSDGFPILLISEESLADLNSRLPAPLPMNRFRPNIVVSGAGVPYAEDCWSEIRVGSLAFSVVKACARCVTTTTDQSTAERGREPLATLATYRRVPRGVLFGQNLIHATPGRIAVGEEVRICRSAPPPVFLSN